jgi:hypothetical protein
MNEAYCVAARAKGWGGQGVVLHSEGATLEVSFIG